MGETYPIVFVQWLTRNEEGFLLRANHRSEPAPPLSLIVDRSKKRLGRHVQVRYLAVDPIPPPSIHSYTLLGGATQRSGGEREKWSGNTQRG